MEEYSFLTQEPIDIAMQGGRSDARNAILHQMFSYLGYGERAGSGLYMISAVWRNKNWMKLMNIYA